MLAFLSLLLKIADPLERVLILVGEFKRTAVEGSLYCCRIQHNGCKEFSLLLEKTTDPL